MSGGTRAGLLLGRNVAQLFLCFVGSALLNVLSQDAFARTGGAHKDLWLSLTLLLGTLASIGGVRTAARRGFWGGVQLTGPALALLIAGLTGILLHLQLAWIFAITSVVLRFLLQYATQELDRRAVALAGEESRRTNDLSGLAMRFGGMLLGPLWFALARGHALASLLAVCALGGLAAYSAWLVREAPPIPPRGTQPEEAPSRVMRAARLIYAAYYLLASSLIYVLLDIHHTRAPTARGGLIITAVYGSAIATTLLAMARGARGPRSPLGMLPAALLALVVGVGLPLPLAAHTSSQVVSAVLLGVAFAWFQLAARDHATRESQRGHRGALEEYNNLANTSALVGYAAMAALVGLSWVLEISYAWLAGAGVAALGLSAAPLVVTAARTETAR